MTVCVLERPPHLRPGTLTHPDHAAFFLKPSAAVTHGGAGRSVYIGAMDTYAIEAKTEGGFQVRVRSASEEPGRIVNTFSTEREAEDWVNSQIQIALRDISASDIA